MKTPCWLALMALPLLAAEAPAPPVPPGPQAPAPAQTADGANPLISLDFQDRPLGEVTDYLSRRACPVLTFGPDPRRTGWESALFKDPRSAAVTWPGSGHRLHEERPAEFLLVVHDWLRSLT